MNKLIHQQKHGPNFVHSLAKGLEILSVFSEGETLGNQQLVEILDMPKATVSRLTSTLVELGFLRWDPGSRKFSMGNRLLGMGTSVQRKHGIQRSAKPFMDALSKEYDLTVSMGARDRLSVVVLEVSRPPNFSRLVVNFDTGTHLPLTKTSLGLACIVSAPVKEQTRILRDLNAKSGDEWSSVRTRIEQAHREYERSGFVTVQQSMGGDVNGIAVAMRPEGSHSPYVFNFAGPANHMTPTYMRKELGPRLQRMTRDIQAAISKTKRPILIVPAENF